MLTILKHAPIVGTIMSKLPLISCLALIRSVKHINCPSAYEIARLRIYTVLQRFMSVETVNVLLNSNKDFAISGGLLLGILTDATWCNPEQCPDLDIFSAEVVDGDLVPVGKDNALVSYQHLSIIHDLYKNDCLVQPHVGNHFQHEYSCSQPYTLLKPINAVHNYIVGPSEFTIQGIRLQAEERYEDFIRNTFDLGFCKNYFSPTRFVVMDPVSILRRQTKINVVSAYRFHLESLVRKWTWDTIVVRLRKYQKRGYVIDMSDLLWEDICLIAKNDRHKMELAKFIARLK